MSIHSQTKQQVLIVDDTPENIQVLCSILYQHGVDIAIAQSGREALDVVAQKPPDLMLLDVIMPGMNGFDVCRELQKNAETSDLPIIFLTAKTDPEDILRGFELGAVDYVTKPFHSAELLARVATHLDLKQSRDLVTAQHQQLANQHQELHELHALKEQYFSDALREREERMRVALEGTDQGLWDWDVLSGDITFDDNWINVLGYTPGERRFDFAWWDSHVHPQSKPEFEKALNAYREGRKKYYELEYQFRAKSGEWRWIWARGINSACDEHGRPTRMIGTHRDITERKRAEDRLRESERQYRFLVENTADGIGIVQAEHLVFVNEALAAMLGCAADELLGQSPLTLFRHDDKLRLQEIYHQFARGMSEAHTAWPVLQCVVDGQNREVWMEGQHSLITWEGQPAMLMSMRDITRRKLREMQNEQERNKLQRENAQLRAGMKNRYKFGDIVGKSQAMQAVYDLIMQASASASDVLIVGDTGTGKELVARTIHQLGPRQGQAFVPVNCGAVPENLFEREFFGHRKGAFTGADSNKQGFFDAAHGGTLFLDEVGELGLSMQVKLLRAIESGEYSPVGEAVVKKVDVRIITATNRNLAELVEKGGMREDFFYRIHVIVVAIPPLRERKEDIPLLVDHFVNRFQHDGKPSVISGRILETLYNYDWPGNIRQLQNVLFRYLTVGKLDFSGPRHVDRAETEAVAGTEPAAGDMLLHEAVEQLEKQLILKTLEKHHWHRTHTAAALGIPRRSLLRKIIKYGLT